MTTTPGPGHDGTPPYPWAAAPGYPGYPGQHGQHGHPPPHPPTPGLPTPPWVLTRPVLGLAIGATIAAVLVTLVEIVEAVAAWPAGHTYAQAARNRVPVDNIVTVYDLAAVVWLVAALVSYVVGCLWLYTARTNTDLLSARPHARARGWVWAGWLVPIVALWFPFQVVRDTRRAIRPAVGGALVGWWWAAWLAFITVTQLGSNVLPLSGRISESDALALGPVETVSAVLAIAACVLWCMLVWRITQEQRHFTMRAQPPPGAVAQGGYGG